MKKIFFALAAVAALAACSKSEATYDDVQNEIALAPVAENITKTMISGTNGAFPTTESFNVWAWYKQLPAQTTTIEKWQKDQSANQAYIVNKTFSKKDGNTDWSGKDAAYYWPKLGSLLFAGYYPSTLAGSVSYTLENSTLDGENVTERGANKMVFTDIWQANVSTQAEGQPIKYDEDIMYFNMTKVSHSTGPVSVIFKHALSWITVKVKKSSEFPKIVIDEIKFTKVNDMGTGTVDNTVDNARIEWVTRTEEEHKNAETVFGRNEELGVDYKTLIEPLFIPQDMLGDLVIKYTIFSSDTEFFTETYTAKLNGFTATGGSTTLSKWEPAKHYTYNIEIGTSEILIAPKVEEWANVEVPVEDLKK